MSRRSQDIPIRPRYGYIDEDDAGAQSNPNSDDTTSGANARNNRNTTTTNNNGGTERVMASSYSEIPFLAQYPGADDLSDAATPTTHHRAIVSSESDLNAFKNDDDEDEVEDDDNESKGSSCEATKTPKRPDSLQCLDSTVPYELEGSVRHEGQMLHFVADNLEHTLKTATPLTKKDVLASHSASRNSTPPSTSTSGLLSRQFLQAQLPQIDANVLNDVEIEAQYLAGAVDNLTENLCNLLHSISSITADNVEVHKNSVNKLTDSMDANIKCMYTIMAKTEEITKSMQPTEQLGQRIREIKRLVDMLEANM